MFSKIVKNYRLITVLLLIALTARETNGAGKEALQQWIEETLEKY